MVLVRLHMCHSMDLNCLLCRDLCGCIVVNVKAKYIIRSTVEVEDDGGPSYFNNDWGWVSKEDATQYEHCQLEYTPLHSVVEVVS